MPKKSIAIDGPAGAGKSTVARLVAKRLNYLYIDTGAMYRALTLKGMKMAIPLNSESLLIKMAEDTRIELFNKGDQMVVLCDDEDVSQAIREPEISQNVSLVAAIPGVRAAMVELQRFMAKKGDVVMDGRDISSVVLPQADCKIFLTASVAERAQRRYQELKTKGFMVSLLEVKKEISHRDHLDQTREIGPLIKCPDAICIDTTGKNIETVVNEILTICGEEA